MATRRTEFGERLFAARKHANLTQAQLADLAGCEQATVGEAEKSGRGSSYTAQFAHYCKVDALWLATGEGSMMTALPGQLDHTGWPFRVLTPEKLATLSRLDAEAVESLAIHFLSRATGRRRSS